MIHIATFFMTKLHGQYVGNDAHDNRYYQRRKPDHHGKRKRWVIYHKSAEASKVPPEWHGWLHYTTDQAPVGHKKRYDWQKSMLPNLTGTIYAYHPSHGESTKKQADYQAWQPNEEHTPTP